MSVSVDVHNFNLEGKKATNSIAMLMVMISFSMLFAALFLGYIIYRNSTEVWPPMGMQRLSLGLPTVSTVLILLSSMTYMLFENSFNNKNKKMMKVWLGVTIALGIGFLATQTQLWSLLKSVGIFADTGIFASIIYAFTWIHAAHMVLGLLSLTYLIPTMSGETDYIFRIQNIAKFWHFLGIVWFVMFFTIFVF